MRCIKFLILFTLLALSQVLSIMLKRKHKKTKASKQIHHQNHRQYYDYYPESRSSPSVISTPYGLQTPLTTGDFSRGGQMYHTNGATIPYGTGYSYGPWKKIPMRR